MKWLKVKIFPYFSIWKIDKNFPNRVQLRMNWASAIYRPTSWNHAVTFHHWFDLFKVKFLAKFLISQIYIILFICEYFYVNIILVNLYLLIKKLIGKQRDDYKIDNAICFSINRWYIYLVLYFILVKYLFMQVSKISIFS